MSDDIPNVSNADENVKTECGRVSEHVLNFWSNNTKLFLCRYKLVLG